jgi:hypothetical protein
MSAAKISALSSMPRSRCKRVPAAGINPVDMAVVPSVDASRSSTSTSAPACWADNAAVSPQPPPPTTSTATLPE